jgi:hypothetical protein
MPRGGKGRTGPGSCVGAVEMSVDRAVSGSMREQGSGRFAWAARERVGRSGKKKARPSPRE